MAAAATATAAIAPMTIGPCGSCVRTMPAIVASASRRRTTSGRASV